MKMASVFRSLRPVASRRILSSVATRSFTVSATRASDQPRGTTEFAVGELEGAKFRIEPLRRTGEDVDTKRARLVCTFPGHHVPFPREVLSTISHFLTPLRRN